MMLQGDTATDSGRMTEDSKIDEQLAPHGNSIGMLTVLLTHAKECYSRS